MVVMNCSFSLPICGTKCNRCINVCINWYQLMQWLWILIGLKVHICELKVKTHVLLLKNKHALMLQGEHSVTKVQFIYLFEDSTKRITLDTDYTKNALLVFLAFNFFLVWNETCVNVDIDPLWSFALWKTLALQSFPNSIGFESQTRLHPI